MHQVLRAAGCAAMLLLTTIVQAQGGGQFLDRLELLADPDGRTFSLLNRFRYVDSTKVTWVVPKGFVSDGASIPRALWSVVGGPWDGEYRRAAVVHDYFFRQRKYASDDIHRVFYDAMLTDGVGWLKAKLMYYAVVRFNKRWHQREVDPFDCNRLQARPGSSIRCQPALEGTYLIQDVEESPRADQDTVSRELESLRVTLETNDLSLTDLKRLADEAYAAGDRTQTPLGVQRRTR